MPEIPLITRARAHHSAIAVRGPNAEITYQHLLDRSAEIVGALLNGAGDLHENRVALLAPAGAEYIAAQWAVWRAGGIVLPLSLSATEPEWEYALTDSGSSMVVATARLAEKIGPLCGRLGIRLLPLDEHAANPPTAQREPDLPAIDPGRRAMILYTSGTTSRPKGVVTTHAHIQAQIESLVTAWEWQPSDRIPLFLPLHHIHGIINVLGCALWSGALVEPFAHFDLPAILARVWSGAYTLFMAVPTIYVKLIDALRNASDAERDAAIAGFRQMRLMVSGSAALPARIHDEWFQLTGRKLLERYGMTEIGMALSNPYHGERRPGSVGLPLPGVEVRLKTESGEIIGGENQPGEIQVRGPGVFREYWNRSEVTAASFENGWFRTGDVAVIEQGYYRILGRQSVDIIKSGGYKLSALEIEAVLLEHPSIRECAVVGVPDETWGETVAAAVVLHDGTTLDLEPLRDWCRDRLSVYKLPKRLLVVQALPRNALGKVMKPAVRGLFS
jgi:malonyl-CoA/methylmalonyl-CoA synthetase